MAVKKHELMPENNLGLLAHYLDISKAYYMLSPADLITMCRSLVVLLSKLDIPKDPTDRTLFYTQVQQVEDYLKKMIMDMEENSKLKLLFGLLKQLYGIISNAGPTTCPAASIILSLSPIANVHRYVNALVSNEDGGSATGSNIEKDNRLRLALSTLCHWLCYWEGTPLLHQYIISFMKALQELNKFEILLDVSMDVICELFDALQFPAVRITVVDVFLHILASTRDSIDAFDKIAYSVPTVLENLASDTSPDSRSVLQNIVEAFTALLDLHPTHKLKYTEIVACLDAHIKSNNCFIMELPKWKRSEKTDEASKDFTKVGLMNLGNTCYMNSALQALVMTKEFSNSIVMSNMTYPLVCSLKSLFALLMHSKLSYVNPEDVFKKSKPANFIRGTQQDSSEFICHLLDRLHDIESTNNLKIKERSELGRILEISDSDRMKNFHAVPNNSAALDMSSNSAANTCDTAKSDEGNRKRRKVDNPVEAKRRCLRIEESTSNTASVQLPKTIVQEVFAGVMNTATRCLQCNFVSSKKDAFWDLQLAFPEGKEKSDAYSISRLLEYYCSPEHLVGNNQYRCQNCESLQDAERSVSIEKAPKNLIVVLKQFFYDSKQRLRAKLFHDVRLDKKITVFEGRVKKFYEMYAVIVHTGSNLDNGHYYTIAKDSPDNWFIFNDSFVSKCQESIVYSLVGVRTPYIVFYKKLEDTNDDNLPGTSSSKAKAEENAPQGESSSDTITFSETEETIPLSLMPAYLVEQVKSASAINPVYRRSSRTKHSRSDDNQPGSSSQ